MKKFTSLIVFVLLTSTLSFATDYALLNTYPLLTDMKTTNKQQIVINDIRDIIYNPNNRDEEFIKLEHKFHQVITGLADGNKHINLKGTNIKVLRNKIDKIQIIWNQNKKTISLALTNTIHTQKALQALNQLATNMEELTTLYNQSYTRYKKNSLLSSIVRNHIYTRTKHYESIAFNFQKQGLK